MYENAAHQNCACKHSSTLADCSSDFSFMHFTLRNNISCPQHLVLPHTQKGIEVKRARVTLHMCHQKSEACTTSACARCSCSAAWCAAPAVKPHHSTSAIKSCSASKPMQQRRAPLAPQMPCLTACKTRCRQSTMQKPVQMPEATVAVTSRVCVCTLSQRAQNGGR